MRRFFVALLFGLFFVKASWVDRDSPQHAKRTVSLADGREQTLVFSDEFSVDGRSFRDGRDPRWTSIHKDDYTNFALQFYNQDLVTTTNGYLNISSVIQDITFDINDVLNQQQTRQTKNYQSGMVQGWNKFCFTGGILEIRAKLPGKAYVGGLWPAMWLLGNLARATYVGSSNNVWPWSYNTCSAELQPQQLISACNTVNHYNLHAKQGRGAPEIDLLEAMPGHEKLINTPIHKPYFSTSLQVAPGSNIEDYRPTVAEVPPEGFWYDRGLEYGPNTSINIFFYGMHLSGSTKQASYLADAISANTNLEPTHFESFHTYRLEWEPYSVAALDSDDDGVQARDEKSKSHGPDDPAPTASPTHKSFNQARDGGAEEVGGYIKWYLDDEFLYSIDTMTLAKTGAIIPQEPMYVILNTALSSTWGFPSPCPENCPCDCFDCREERCQCGCPAEMCSNFPAHFLIDYVRVYQRQNGDTGGKGHVVGCSPPLHPTKTYIKGNADLFMKKGDVEPLLPVQTGGAECENAGTRSESAFRDPKGTCGVHGTCVKKKCVCDVGITGPDCKAYAAADDIDWEPEKPLYVVPPSLPSLLLLLASLLGLALVGNAIYRYKFEDTARGLARIPFMGYTVGHPGAYIPLDPSSACGLSQLKSLYGCHGGQDCFLDVLIHIARGCPRYHLSLALERGGFLCRASLSSAALRICILDRVADLSRVVIESRKSMEV